MVDDEIYNGEMLYPGFHTVYIEKLGYEIKNSKIKVLPNKQNTFEYTLKKRDIGKEQLLRKSYIDNSVIYDEVYTYENYIVFERKDYLSFEVYLRDTTIMSIKHKDHFSPIFRLTKEQTFDNHRVAHFMGIYNNLLFIDYGTAPGLRGLEIYYIKSNELVFSGNHLEYFNLLNDNTILIMKYISKEEIQNKYPNVIKMNLNKIKESKDYGFGYGFAQNFSFNLDTLEIKNLNTFTCYLTQ